MRRVVITGMGMVSLLETIWMRVGILCLEESRGYQRFLCLTPLT